MTELVPLHLDALHFAYGNAEVLRGCSLSVNRGEWVALAGLNGAGKTTLLRCAAGLLTPSSGNVHVAGEPFTENPAKARTHLGTMISVDEIPGELELDQYLDLVRSAHGDPRENAIVSAMYQGFGLHTFAHMRLARCSLGTRQKTAIVAAFIGNPQVVLLDEPFNGLDSESQQAAKQAFRQFLQHGALLMASHTIEIVHAWCSRLDCLVDGRIVDRIDLANWRLEGHSIEALEQRLLAHRQRDMRDSKYAA